MAALHKLTSVQVKTSAPGKYCDGGNLWLVKKSAGHGQWVFRATVHGRRREMGLGAYPAVGLKEARQQAERWRTVVRDGGDPVKVRTRERRVRAREEHLLSDIAIQAFEARKPQLKQDGQAGRWFSPLEQHILPKLGRLPIEQIDQRDIRDALAPIWHAKTDAAKKGLNRLRICIKYAAALGLDVDIQAPEKAKQLLGAQRHTVRNIPSVLWPDVPDFYASLSDATSCHLALRLLILTAVRSKGVRYCHLDEIVGDLWTVPAERMKSGRALRVPLSVEALNVIEKASANSRDGFLFPNVRKGVISDATMIRMMERRGMEERPHGFRSSFRTWCAEATSTPREIAETALDHVSGGRTELAYRRTDYLDQRRALMERWSEHCAGAAANVVPLLGRA